MLFGRRLFFIFLLTCDQVFYFLRIRSYLLYQLLLLIVEHLLLGDVAVEVRVLVGYDAKLVLVVLVERFGWRLLPPKILLVEFWCRWLFIAWLDSCVAWIGRKPILVNSCIQIRRFTSRLITFFVWTQLRIIGQLMRWRQNHFLMNTQPAIEFLLHNNSGCVTHFDWWRCVRNLLQRSLLRDS